MQYKKITSAVLCFLLLSFGSISTPATHANISQNQQMLPMLKSFLEALVVLYPTKTFALCITQENFPLIVDAIHIQPALAADEVLTRAAHDGIPDFSSSEIVVVSADAAVNPPLTAFHTASMSVQSGYHELPRPAKVLVQPNVFNRPQQQQNSAAPQGHLRPSVPNSPWRSIGDSQALFWLFATILPSV